MGSNVSLEGCRASYNVTLNCVINPGISYGQFARGGVPTDPDIAGIGIVSAFIAVTAFALLIGFADVIWQTVKSFKRGRRIWRIREDHAKIRSNPSVSDIFESLIISCSDQQLFTGGAYAIIIRYYRGCTVSAYHYNIVVNGLLVTCATHLVAVTVVMNYWKYPFMAMLRIVITLLVFLVTGLLLSKRNGSESTGAFPVVVPPADTTEGPLFLPAACFQDSTSTNKLGDRLQDTFQNLGSLLDTHSQGWNLYVAMLFWWAFAIAAEFSRFLRRGARKEQGNRANLARKVDAWVFPEQRGGKPRIFRQGAAKIFSLVYHVFFLLYLWGGLAISTLIVIGSAIYIQALRHWVKASGWIDLDDNGEDPEDNPATFGQLVPLFLTSLTVFAFLQMLNERLHDHYRKKKLRADNAAVQEKYDDDNPPPLPAKEPVVRIAGSHPPTGSVPLRTAAHQPSWAPTTPGSIPYTPGTTHTVSPLLSTGGLNVSANYFPEQSQSPHPPSRMHTAPMMASSPRAASLAPPSEPLQPSRSWPTDVPTSSSRAYASHRYDGRARG